MVHQEQHDRGTDRRLGTAWSMFTIKPVGMNIPVDPFGV